MSETSIDWPEDLKLLLFPGDVHIDALFEHESDFQSSGSNSQSSV